MSVYVCCVHCTQLDDVDVLTNSILSFLAAKAHLKSPTDFLITTLCAFSFFISNFFLSIFVCALCCPVWHTTETCFDLVKMAKTICCLNIDKLSTKTKYFRSLNKCQYNIHHSHSQCIRNKCNVFVYICDVPEKMFNNILYGTTQTCNFFICCKSTNAHAQNT